ncbi:unnamed protein product [Penicillium salamii]|uniref:Heterokaryon incompatibility domain-containing protein n=1 Tax=Penicillium salamii TaxID=1612424 RepID=A0A9W4IMJ6_9EURO|nr:unnamed protein product [Penicillium salamii]CAG7995833.1 unnamed protein product [Penicillium salamii]CAG8164598.1 unnamed protein product [Penicillium salamii]CAG8193342.1 unnamed protein product [Penicillium salamii]CAG8226235.1 unnamed protein product [Penicillium salamii]
MDLFVYSALPEEHLYMTRMVHLLPDTDRNAPIECKLFNYDLSVGDGRSHIYEALSYCWESGDKPKSIILNGYKFSVTENLFSALQHLRDRQLPRTLWIDAICINQADSESDGKSDVNEKTKQIPLMRQIYAQAGRVIVWLGDDRGDGGEALRWINHLAGLEDGHSKKNPMAEHGLACSNLLQRGWFRRVWVLQEVGVARYIDVLCGSTQISAHAFAEGLARLFPQPLLSRLGPVTHLIKGAPYRPKFDIASPGIFSLGELLGMYRSYRATLQHDKIYALLGLSADASADVLKPNYNAPWHTVFREITSHIFPGSFVQTWEGRASAVVKTKGWIMGHVGHVTSSMQFFGQQDITCHFHKSAFSLRETWPSDWMLPACAELVHEGDLICHLQGQSRPSILRLCNDHFSLLSPSLWPRSMGHIQNLSHTFDQGQLDYGRDITLTWNIPMDKLAATPKELKLKQITPEVEDSLNEIELRLEIIAQVMLNVATQVLDSKTSQVKAWENILKQRGTDVSVSEIYELAFRVIKPDLRTDRVSDEKSKGILYREFIDPLLKYSGESAPDVEMLRWACQDYGWYGVLDLLFKHRAESLPITEEVLKAVAQNQSTFNVKALSEHRRERLPVSEEVLKLAADNRGTWTDALEALEIFLQRAGENPPISEEVVKAAAGARVFSPLKVLKVLLQYAGGKFPISEEVVKAAAENPAIPPYWVLEPLLQHVGENPPISEEVVKAAAGNPGYFAGSVLEVLFQHAGENLLISEEVVKAAAGNTGDYGHEALETLFRHRESLAISEEVFKAAAGNDGDQSMQIMQILKMHRQDSAVISQAVLEAASENPRYASEMSSFLNSWHSEQSNTGDNSPKKCD